MVGEVPMKLLTSIVRLILIPVLPALFQDMVAKANKWGNGGTSGTIDPFTEIFNVSISLYQRTVSLGPR